MPTITIKITELTDQVSKQKRTRIISSLDNPRKELMGDTEIYDEKIDPERVAALASLQVLTLLCSVKKIITIEDENKFQNEPPVNNVV